MIQRQESGLLSSGKTAMQLAKNGKYANPAVQNPDQKDVQHEWFFITMETSKPWDVYIIYINSFFKIYTSNGY